MRGKEIEANGINFVSQLHKVYELIHFLYVSTYFCIAKFIIVIMAQEFGTSN